MKSENATDAAVDSAGDYVSSQAAKLCDMIEDIAKTAPEAAKEKLECLRAGVTSLCESGKDKAAKVVGKVTDTIKAYPLQSAAAAVGVGLLTWWVLSRRR